MITVYTVDAQGVFTAAINVDQMGPMPVPLSMVEPPATAGNEVAQWDGIAWAVLDERPAPPAGPTDEQLRAAMAPVSPLQGILTLGETGWNEVLAFRNGVGSDGNPLATWVQRTMIDNASDWVRTSQNMTFIGYLLGYTDVEMDALFADAALVVV